jgi:transposase InsO family protein
MRTELVTDALAAAHALAVAQRTRGSLADAIMLTDHGSPHTVKHSPKPAGQQGTRQDMGAIGSSTDNALTKSFNATFKRETLHDPQRLSIFNSVIERVTPVEPCGWQNGRGSRAVEGGI